MLAPALIVALAVAGGRAGAAPAAAPDPGVESVDDADLVRLRFDWPASVEAEAVERRTRLRSGQRPVVTTTRFTRRAERREDGALAIATARTRWEGDAPAPGPKDAVAALVRASGEVVQVVSPEGELLRLERTEALRPALETLFAAEELSEDQRARALDAAEGAARAQAREAWNLAVGFWTGADLELGVRYVMKADRELPFGAGATVTYDQEFSVRRRVPCSAGERALRCVEITLRSTPDPEVLPAAARALLPRLAGSRAVNRAAELSIEDELLLVTEPATLLPRRVVWTRAVRAAPRAADDAAPVVELVDRTETEYRYPPPRRPARKASRTAASLEGR